MVEFKTKFNDANVQSAAKFQIKKFIWLFILMSLIFVVIGIVCILTSDGWFDADGLISTKCLMGIIFITVGLLLPIIFYGAFKHSQKNLNKMTSLISEETFITYTFDENEITISEKKGEVFESFTRVKYVCLFNASENNTHYILYLAKMQYYYIDKTSLTQGTLEELNGYLIKNLGLKFQRAKQKSGS